MINSQPPQILWLTNLPAPYRFPIWDRIAETFDLKVAFLLKEKNWRNWTVPTGQTWRHEYLSLKSINIKEYDFIPSIRGAKKLLLNVDLLVLGGWETPFYIRILLLAKKRHIPVIQIYESTKDSQRFKNGLIPKIRANFFSKIDFVITFGDSSTKATKAMGVAPEKILTLFNPVDVSWYHTFSHNNRKLPAPGHRYIYVGQLIDRKNVENIINSFATLRNKFDTLTIAGDGPLAQKLKDLVATLKIEDSVIFAGHRNKLELAELYATSNTLILASTNEVWGLVVNEALASGLHAVVADKCGVAEFVKNMKGVFICSTDQNSLKAAMELSLRQWVGYIESPEILKFTPEKFTDEVIKLFSLKLDIRN
jgi:glycosyltransferase involved in cell wall biosynthesis